jgi:hypothetical protein|tara:strand:+ start:34163 stop:34738 length:576 start_codon:yes stop_codon:yes gene_type:complete
LGAPIGKKSNINLTIPNWIIQNPKFQDFFFSAFFGNEIGIPKIHKDNKRTDSLDIGLVSKKEFLKNRTQFLNHIQNYLKSREINADKIHIQKHKQDKNSHLMKLALNLNFDNLMNFYKNIQLSYSQNKQAKLENTLKQLQIVKLDRFKKLSNTLNKLTQRNYSKKWIKHNLRLTNTSLKFILNKEHLEKWE